MLRIYVTGDWHCFVQQASLEGRVSLQDPFQWQAYQFIEMRFDFCAHGFGSISVPSNYLLMCVGN